MNSHIQIRSEHFLEIISSLIQPAIAQNSNTWDFLRRLILLEDYNTRVVLLGTAMLGCAAGVVGVFTLLRKRALMGDAISHATLPGITLS